MLRTGAIKAAGAYFLVSVIIFLVIFTVFLIPEPSFASKSVSIQKKIDARTEIVDEIFSDVTNYKKLFGENVVLVEELNENSVRIVIKITSPISCTIDSIFEHKIVGGSHVIDYISGLLKGSRLTASLSKTWNFAGTDPEGGTLVDANFYVKDVPCVWDWLVNDGDIKFILDKGIMQMGEHAKTLQRELDEKNKKYEQPSPPPTPPIPKTTPPTQPTKPKDTPPIETIPTPPTQPTKPKDTPTIDIIPTPQAPPKEQIPVFNQKVYYVFEYDMPKHWEKDYKYVLSDATKFWEQKHPDIKFYKVSEYERADLTIQWASEYASGEAGYYKLDKNRKPEIAVTLGFFENTEKLDKMEFHRVSADYAATITKHELGHFLGYEDSNDRDSIMYYTIEDYYAWTKAKLPQMKQFLDKEASKPDYKIKSLDLQFTVNSKINVLKTGVTTAENSLYKVDYESAEAKIEVEKAWNAFWLAKKYLNDAELTQKESETMMDGSQFENAYYKYVYSLNSAEKIADYLFEISDHLDIAQTLEEGYKAYENKQQEEKKEEQKTCVLVWCW